MRGAGMPGAQRIEFEHRGRTIGDRNRQRDKTAFANVDFGTNGGGEGVRGQLKLRV